MFKAFLKKVEETTNLLEASLKIKDATKPLDSIIKEIPPLPDSIKNIDISLKNPGPPPSLYKENIDLHPGSTFLKKYQEKLGELHSNNVIIAKKAEAVDRKLPTLVRHTTNHHEVWRKLQGELARLPELSANVSNIRNQIDFVLVKFDELEMLLSAQVEQYHQTELAKHKERLSNDGVRYQAQKQRELAGLEEELATTKARYERDKANKEKDQARLQRLEQEQLRRKKEEEETRERRKKQEQELKEKKQKEEEEKKQQDKLRSAFGNAFQHQMDQFKKFGSTGPPPKKEDPIAPIEAIVPEENPKALDEFFQDLVNSSDKLKKEAEGEKEEVEEDKERNPLVKADDLLSSTDQVRKEAEGEKEEAKVEEIAVGSVGEEEKEKPTQEQALASDDKETSADQQKLAEEKTSE